MSNLAAFEDPAFDLSAFEDHILDFAQGAASTSPEWKYVPVRRLRAALPAIGAPSHAQPGGA